MALPRLTTTSVETGITPEVQGPTVEARNFATETGQRLAAAAGQAGGQFVEIAARMQDEENITYVNNAAAQLDSYAAERAREAEKVEGLAARGIAANEAEKFKKQRGDIAGKLSPVQRDLFHARTLNSGVHFTDRLARHEYKQNQIATERAMEASLEAKVNVAAADPYNVRAVSEARQDVDTQLKAWAKLRGLEGAEGKDIIDQKRLTLTTKLYRSMMDNMLASEDPEGARKLFESNKSEILGAQHDEIKKTLKIAEEVGISQDWLGKDRASDGTSRQNMITNIASTELAGLEEQMLAEARKKHKGSQEQKVTTEIERRFAQRRTQDAQKRVAATEAAEQIFARTRNINAIPAEILAGMDGRTRMALENVERKDIKGEKIDSDMDLYDRLHSTISNGGTVNLGEHADKISPAHREKLINLRDSVERRVTGEAAKFEKAITPAEKEEAFNQMRLGNRTKADKEKRGMFTDAVDAELQRARATKQSGLSPDERDAAIKRYMREGAIRGSTLGISHDTAVRYYQVAGKETQQQFRSAVVSEEMAPYLNDIEAAIKGDGLPVTDANRNAYFERAKANEAKKRNAAGR